jgi:hypothetical protein
MLSDIDINLNNHVTIPGSWLANIGDNLKKIHNDHWDILDLVKYVNALIMIHETSSTKKIFFVNTLSPWCRNYFEQKTIIRPSDLDPYEQDLLQVETRDDNEIDALYQMIHQQYSYYGGIKESHWLNLYDSLRSMQVDNASATDAHPGYISQEKYSEYLGRILREKLGYR